MPEKSPNLPDSSDEAHRAAIAGGCAILGAGLVGSYLGAAAGASTVFSRSPGAAVVRRVALPNGVRWWRPVALSDPRVVNGPLLVSCRAHQTPWDDLPPDVLVAQNGLGQPRPVIACFFALDLDADGTVCAIGPAPRIVLAPPGPSWSGVLASWREAGITVELAPDARPAQWEKAILNATVGPLCLATGLGMAAVWSDAALRALVLQATGEGADIAASCAVRIADGLADRASSFFASVGAHRPSVLRDDGELPWIVGHLRRQAQLAGIACPGLDRIDLMVRERIGSAASPRDSARGRR
ncbi:MAG: hypothetical protein H0V44_12055 [Planctomycetes bacterium]|nr:hypothetical protein [Planctomycetota bacterium]